MRGWILPQVCFRQFEQGGRGAGPVLLQMDKRAGELDEAFVKRTVWTVPLGQPNLFQDFVRLEEKLAVEAREIAQVMGVQVLALELVNDRRDLVVLLAHGWRIES